MALTALQRAICRIIATNRKSQGEAYVAGAVALDANLELFRGDAAAITQRLRAGEIRFHLG